MRTSLQHLLTAFVLVLFAGPCLGMMSIEFVTRARAKALGMEVRTVQAGPRDLRVELEFEIKGELKDYTRVDLEIKNGNKWVSASLQEEKAKPGHVLVSFAADRASLDQITMRVVTRPGEREMTGYDLRIKDFVEGAKGP
jgi:hypothetical protein